jgi:hypothetical protein
MVKRAFLLLGGPALHIRPGTLRGLFAEKLLRYGTNEDNYKEVLRTTVHFKWEFTALGLND